MKLLEEIISLASSEEGSLATLLRKCLVLSHTLKNDRLKVWAEKELNGYEIDDTDLPEYRKIAAPAKGLFLGGFGSQIDKQPIPPAILKKDHRHWAESMELLQPIASYDSGPPDKNLIREWPANLTILYQASFFEGQYALNRAWQEISTLTVIGFLDIVKTRVLQLALELRDDISEVDENLTNLPAEKIDQTVINIIYGGQNVISSTGVTQIGSVHINKGEWESLSTALEKNLGLSAGEILELQNSIDEDSSDRPYDGLGHRTLAWLKKIGLESGGITLKVGKEIAEKIATEWILEYLGIH